MQKEFQNKNFPAIIKHAKSRKGDVRVNYSNINRAKEILSCNRIPVSYTGINKTINYFTMKKYKIANIIEEGFFEDLKEE